MKNYRKLAPVSSRAFDKLLQDRNPENADFDIDTGRPITDDGWEAYLTASMRWPYLNDAQILSSLLEGPEVK